METKPINPKTANIGTLATGHNQLHRCLEDHRRETRASFKAAKLAQEITSADILAIKDAIGIGENPRRTLATMGQWKAAFIQAGAVAGGGVGIIGAYKLAVALAPVIWRGLLAINHVVLTT